MENRFEFKSDFDVVSDPSTLRNPVFNLLGLACAVIAILGKPVLIAIVSGLMPEPRESSGLGWMIGMALGISSAWLVLSIAGLILAGFSLRRKERWRWLAILQIGGYAVFITVVAGFWLSLFVTGN